MESMNIVRQDDDGTLYVTADDIAEKAGSSVESLKRVIRLYRRDFEKFGGVGTEFRTLQTAGGQQKIATPKLNEHQATLLLTYMRNNEKVRAFKQALVEEFYQMAKALQNREQDPSLVMARGLEAAQLVIAQKDQKIAELTPKADAWDSLVGSSGTWSFGEAAAALQEVGGIDIGRNRLFKLAGEWGFIFREGGSWLSYQRYRDQALFEHKLRHSRDHETGELVARPPQVRITGKGLSVIRAKLVNAEARELEAA